MDGHAHVPVSEDTITVFLLDDHEVVRRGLRDPARGRADDIEVVGEAGHGRGGRWRGSRRCVPTSPSLDGRLPDGVGHRGVPRGPVGRPDASRCLILTSYDDDEALFAAIMAGASGYVLKQISGSDLVDAVRRVAAGQSLLDPAVTARVLDRLRQRLRTGTRSTQRLTEQERKVLGLIAEGLTNRQIGERMFLAEKTVKNYVSTLLAKLGLERRTQAAVMAARRPTAGDGRPGHPAP